MTKVKHFGFLLGFYMYTSKFSTSGVAIECGASVPLDPTNASPCNNFRLGEYQMLHCNSRLQRHAVYKEKQRRFP